MQVLVIDGEPVLRAAWKYLLTERGYEVVVAASGEEGISESFDMHPDLALIDVDALWPVTQGLSTIAVIREEFPEAQILVLSSWLNRRKALEAGANVCLPKPVDYAAVLRLADMMIGRATPRFRQALAESGAQQEQYV